MSEDKTNTLQRGRLLAPPLPLVIRTGAPARPRELLLENRSVVGSGSRCDLIIDDATVSRQHVELSLVPEGVAVRDLGSRNGTYYLGQRIAEAVLAPGARIVLGRAELHVELDPRQITDGEPLAGTSFRGMSGASPGMLRLFTAISRLDGSLVPVLVRGESGVGKELVARAIHEGSRMSSGPFVPVNCGTLSKELAASALFGHRRGAFTGAHEARRGAFAAAHGGTLLLDEIGELPLDVQPALLRVLETSEVQPIGEDVPQKVRIRLLAATNRDLRERVESGQFREDLYFRLAVVTLEVPPLRQRRSDIPDLARMFAREEGAAHLDEDIVEELSNRELPGNVRELRNAVLAYVALGDLAGAEPASRSSLDLPGVFEPRLDVPYLAQRDALVDGFSRRYLRVLLEQTDGNQSEAARIAGLDRTYLGRLLAKLGMASARR